MIGEIRKALTPFYDSKTHCQSFKSRPMLVIAQADTEDYVVLPISRITRKENRHPDYDLEVDPTIYPKLNLNAVSYIRTHKQTIVHAGEIGDSIGDLKHNYENLFLMVLEKREQFSKEITNQALE